jgi:hypothetical protein
MKSPEASMMMTYKKLIEWCWDRLTHRAFTSGDERPNHHLRTWGRTMSNLTAALLFCTAADAETIRYIAQPLGDGRDASFDFQKHTTSTPYVSEGGSITIPRAIGSSVFAYKHGLDVTVVTLSVGQSVTVRELNRVNGVQSNVFMPTAVPNVAAKAGGIGYSVVPARDLRIGDRRSVELRYPLGDKNTFVAVAGCHPTISDGQAKLTSGAIKDNALGPNQETELTIAADVPARCGGQPLVVNAPACFKVQLKHQVFTSQLASRLTLTWPDTDPALQTFTLKADATCDTANQHKEVTATLSGIALPRKPLVTWTQPVFLPTRLPPPAASDTGAPPYQTAMNTLMITDESMNNDR